MGYKIFVIVSYSRSIDYAKICDKNDAHANLGTIDDMPIHVT